MTKVHECVLPLPQQQPKPQENDATSLKAKLRSLLLEHHGSTEHSCIIEVLEELSSLNPSTQEHLQQQHIADLPLMFGEFQNSTAPTFPGRIRNEDIGEDVVQYTLGRLSFNIFQPSKLVCTLLSTRNKVVPMSPPEQSQQLQHQQYAYFILCDIVIHTEKGDLPAILRNEAILFPHSDKFDRCKIRFSGGTLMPADELKNDAEKLKLWDETFQDAYKKAAEERGMFGTLVQSMFKFAFGLTSPTDDVDLSKHTFHFDMKRSPVGYIDILYLDEDLRVTKGNRGTYVVVDRVNHKVLCKE